MKKNIVKKIKKSMIFLLLSFIITMILIPIIHSYLKVLEKCFNTNYNLLEIKSIMDCFYIVGHNKIITSICFIIDLILIFICINILFTRKRLKNENEGIDFKSKDGTHGTASFTSPEEIDILKIGDEKETSGLLLGKSLDTGEIITLPDSYKSVNRNIMVWGASGSRKIY